MATANRNSQRRAAAFARVRRQRAADLTRSGGMTLAMQLLSELEGNAAVTDACSLETECRPTGRPQRNIVLEYLNAVDGTASPDVRAGFASVLSDYVACCAGGAVPDSDFYERFMNTAT